MVKQRRGKKNVIKIDPFAYNVGLLGESGIGKTSTMVELLDKYLGEDGYILCNVGREDGVDAIPDAIYEDIKTFEDLEDFIDDIITDRNTLYKDLKVVVIDTLDEMFRITEPYVVDMHNKEASADKKTKSIKGAFGGYMGGEDKAIDLVIDKIWELKDVGIQPWILAHTKTKSKNDAMSGSDYDILTNNMKDRYFNAIKTKLHILGVASFDRSIEKTTQKNKAGKLETKGKIVDERRIITFRDDNHSVDSKSRFAEIVDQVPLDADALYNVLVDAIQKAHDKQKNKKSIEETKIEQDQQKEVIIEKKLDEVRSKPRINVKKNKEFIDIIKANFGKASSEQKEVMKEIREKYNIVSFDDAETIETEGLQKIAEALA